MRLSACTTVKKTKVEKVRAKRERLSVKLVKRQVKYDCQSLHVTVQRSTVAVEFVHIFVVIPCDDIERRLILRPRFCTSSLGLMLILSLK